MDEIFFGNQDFVNLEEELDFHKGSASNKLGKKHIRDEIPCNKIETFLQA